MINSSNRDDFTLELNPMGTTEEILAQLKREAFSGGLGKASPETLDGYAAALCHSQAFSHFGAHEYPQVCETVRIHLLRAHIARLQSHITDLDAKNTRLTKWVIALAVAALISTLVQTVVAIRAEVRAGSQSQSTAPTPKPQAFSAPAATPVQTPSTPLTAPARKQP